MNHGEKPAWPKIAVMGAGAVGCYFGGMLARAGAPVALIGRRKHVEAFAREGLFIDSAKFQEHVTVGASTEPSAVRGAALVLFSVKTISTEKAARAIAPHLDAGAMVLSLQNGVDNVERIRAAGGFAAFPAAVYVAAEMRGPGRVKHNGRGDLIIGPSAISPAPAEKFAWIAGIFERAGVPCRISENIESELWTKLIFNSAGNAVSALGRCTYGRAARSAEARELIRAAAEEAMAVARAAGVRLPQTDLIAMGLKLVEQLGEATSSTEQDLAHGRRTEIDSLNGYIVRRGREMGVPTPVNQALWALVKLLEPSGPNSSS
ncbi:MAG: ketopantoate reductase family protein [Candidatus Acidiferrales bacterium]